MGDRNGTKLFAQVISSLPEWKVLNFAAGGDDLGPPDLEGTLFHTHTK